MSSAPVRLSGRKGLQRLLINMRREQQQGGKGLALGEVWIRLKPKFKDWNRLIR